jgi:hypothetical protein
MAAPDRKRPASAVSKRQTSKRVPRKGTLPKRPTARISEVDGAIAVLANDPEFQKRVAEQMAVGKAAQEFGRMLVEVFRRVGAAQGGERGPLVSHDAMQAAADFLSSVEEHNEPATDDDVAEMVRSWSE